MSLAFLLSFSPVLLSFFLSSIAILLNSQSYHLLSLVMFGSIHYFYLIGIAVAIGYFG
jgi:hypothetical protein